MRPVWSPLASEQVDVAVAYIAADNPAAALAWLERLLERVKALPDFPGSGRMVPEYQREDVREVFVGPYRVMYRRSADAVEIVAIRHGARDVDVGEAAPYCGADQRIEQTGRQAMMQFTPRWACSSFADRWVDVRR